MDRKNEVLEILKKVNYPGLKRDIVSFGFVKKVEVNENTVFIEVEVSTKNENYLKIIEEDIKSKMKDLDWIRDLKLSVRKVGERKMEERMRIPIKGKSVFIYSTKGGVGKSSVAVNLAYALSILGYRVALLDLDVYGPSVPKMTGTEGYEPQSPDGVMIIPAEREGVRIMSLGYIAGENVAVAWRGPMASKAFEALTFQTLWPDAEFLIGDMPPGSGDIQLSLAQKTLPDGIIMVTTPQKIALADVKRGINMFLKLGIKILGVIENMSYFICDCGKKHFILGSGGGEEISKEFNIPLLGKIPFDPRIVELEDKGEIFVLKHKESQAGKEFIEIAKRVAKIFYQ